MFPSLLTTSFFPFSLQKTDNNFNPLNWRYQKLKHLKKDVRDKTGEREREKEKLSEIVSNLREFHLFNGGKRNAELIALQSERVGEREKS